MEGRHGVKVINAIDAVLKEKKQYAACFTE
jgi:hypothetical protein